MMSPIGQYLAEFRPAGSPGFVPAAVEDLPADLADSFDFAPGEDMFPAAPDDVAAPDEEPLPVAEPEPMQDAPSGIAVEAVIAALKAEHAAELAAARQQWVETEGTALAARMAQCFDDLERKLADTLAPMLEPFLAKAAQVKVLDQIREAIDTLLAGGQAPVAISGPEDLLDAIKRAYPGRPSLVFQTTDEPDVSIALGDTRIRSQLRSWARKLDAALGAPR